MAAVALGLGGVGEGWGGGGAWTWAVADDRGEGLVERSVGMVCVGRSAYPGWVRERVGERPNVARHLEISPAM